MELSTQDGCIMWGNRIVIHLPAQTQVLDELHAGHPGVSRMKTLTQMFVWWPGLGGDIEERVKCCRDCQTNRFASPFAPLQPWLWPTSPWARIHIDHSWVRCN